MIDKLLQCKLQDAEYIENLRIGWFQPIKEVSPYDMMKVYAGSSVTEENAAASKYNPYDYYYYTSNKNLIYNKILIPALKVDNRNIFEFKNDSEMYDIWVDKALQSVNGTTFDADFYIGNKDKNALFGGEDYVVNIAIFLNREANRVSARAKLRPANIFMVHPAQMDLFDYTSAAMIKVSEKNKKVNGPDYIFNSCIDIYITDTIPKDKIIVALVEDDVRKNLFQIVGNKIVFMTPTSWSPTSFEDSISIIDVRRTKY